MAEQATVMLPRICDVTHPGKLQVTSVQLSCACCGQGLQARLPTTPVQKLEPTSLGVSRGGKEELRLHDSGRGAGKSHYQRTRLKVRVSAFALVMCLLILTVSPVEPVRLFKALNDQTIKLFICFFSEVISLILLSSMCHILKHLSSLHLTYTAVWRPMQLHRRNLHSVPLWVSHLFHGCDQKT